MRSYFLMFHRSMSWLAFVLFVYLFVYLFSEGMKMRPRQGNGPEVVINGDRKPLRAVSNRDPQNTARFDFVDVEHQVNQLVILVRKSAYQYHCLRGLTLEHDAGLAR